VGVQFYLDGDPVYFYTYQSGTEFLPYYDTADANITIGRHSANGMYHFQAMAAKDGSCPWTTGASNQVPIDSPPPAPQVNATATNSFKIQLDWADTTGEEGLYQHISARMSAFTVAFPHHMFPGKPLTYTLLHHSEIGGKIGRATLQRMKHGRR